jgi:hypothetical protein
MQRSHGARSCPLSREAGEAPLALLRLGHSHIHVQQVRGEGIPNRASTYAQEG